jgi:molybdopterin-containing oxidoreductase family membrane subunit
VLFENLAKLLVLMSAVWFGLTVVHHLLVWFGNQPGARQVLGVRIRGPYAVYFWTMLALNVVLPLVLLGSRRLRSVGTAGIAAVAVLVGMWLDWYLLVVPTLAHPHLPAVWGGYSPSGLEISITISGFAAMTLLYLTFSKLFPIIVVWEYKQVYRPGIAVASRRGPQSDRLRPGRTARVFGRTG